MADVNMQGFDKFQEKLLNMAQKEFPKETKKMFRKAGSRGLTHVRREARSKVDTKGGTGNYYKGFKRGKVFKGENGEYVVRLLNKSPHGHLIEKGHYNYNKSGGPYGFTPGKHIMENGTKNFQQSGDFEKKLAEGIDQLIKNSGL